MYMYVNKRGSARSAGNSAIENVCIIIIFIIIIIINTLYVIIRCDWALATMYLS